MGKTRNSIMPISFSHLPQLGLETSVAGNFLGGLKAISANRVGMNLAIHRSSVVAKRVKPAH